MLTTRIVSAQKEVLQYVVMNLEYRVAHGSIYALQHFYATLYVVTSFLLLNIRSRIGWVQVAMVHCCADVHYPLKCRYRLHELGPLHSGHTNCTPFRSKTCYFDSKTHLAHRLSTANHQLRAGLLTSLSAVLLNATCLCQRAVRKCFTSICQGTRRLAHHSQG